MKSHFNLICLVELDETDSNYQYVKIFRQAQCDIKLYF